MILVLCDLGERLQRGARVDFSQTPDKFVVIVDSFGFVVYFTIRGERG